MPMFPAFLLGVTLSAICALLPQLAGQTSSHVTFRYGGDTVARGINNAGVVAGYYFNEGRWKGFVRAADGSFQTLEIPGAAGTKAMAINDRGDMILWDTGSRYYLRNAAGVLTLLDGGAAGTLLIATGINNDGWITGAMSRPGGRTAPFFRSPAGVYEFPLETSFTQWEGRAINNSGYVAAFFGGPQVGGTLGLSRAMTTTPDFIDQYYDYLADDPHEAFGINNGQAVVGTLGNGQSFLTTRFKTTNRPQLAAFAVPGFVKTYAYGIADDGRIAGSVESATGQLSGFLLSACQAAVSTTSISAHRGSANYTFSVQAQAPCVWYAETDAPWVNFFESFGNGAGLVETYITSNDGPERQARVKVAGKEVIVTQATGCTGSFGGLADIPAIGGSFQVTWQVTPSNCPWSFSNISPWLTMTPASGTGNTVITVMAASNNTEDERVARFQVFGDVGEYGRQRVASCAGTLNPASVDAPSSGGEYSVVLSMRSGCTWRAHPYPGLEILKPLGDSGTPIRFRVGPNPGVTNPRTIQLQIDGGSGLSYALHYLPIRQPASPPGSCFYEVWGNSPIRFAAGTLQLSITTALNCTWTARPEVPWVRPAAGGTELNGMPGVMPLFIVDQNPYPVSREGRIRVQNQVFVFTQEANSSVTRLGFVPVTPCRILDTRGGLGFTGAYGPPSLAASETRTVSLAGRCGLPAASAYSLNVTVVPKGQLNYLTVWNSDPVRPFVSTLNSANGRVVANAAIIQAVNSAISIYATNPTDVIVDVNGYFTPLNQGGLLSFFPVTPCRLLDTRTETGPLTGGAARTLAIAGARCGVPATASGFSLNATAVPRGVLGYLTLWPSGLAQPLASTLNSWNGQVVANAALVPAGVNGSINMFVSDTADLVLDINGYFAPAHPEGLQYLPIPPCRIADTRASEGFTGAFGPPVLQAQASRAMAPPNGVCGVPPIAKAYVFNATVVPTGVLGYLSLFPSGPSWPLSSTLNSWDAQVVANMAIVPDSGQGVSALASDRTDLILDLNGYFAPQQ